MERIFERERLAFDSILYEFESFVCCCLTFICLCESESNEFGHTYCVCVCVNKYVCMCVCDAPSFVMLLISLLFYILITIYFVDLSTIDLLVNALVTKDVQLFLRYFKKQTDLSGKRYYKPHCVANILSCCG